MGYPIFMKQICPVLYCIFIDCPSKDKIYTYIYMCIAYNINKTKQNTTNIKYLVISKFQWNVPV